MSHHQQAGSRAGRPRRPPPPPKEANDRLATAIITAAWAVALVVVLVAYDALPAGSRWWLWTCVTGVVMGLLALWYVPFLKRGRTRAATGRGQPSEPDSGYVSRDSGSNTVSSTETPGSSTKS